MTDPDLVAKKLAAIETYLQDLRSVAQIEGLEADIREQRFIEHTLQLAIQTVLYVASHIVSDERLGEPRTSRELIVLLQKAGWFDSQLSMTLQNMVGFRNILVHGYDTGDLAIVRDIYDNRLTDFETFVASVRKRLS